VTADAASVLRQCTNDMAVRPLHSSAVRSARLCDDVSRACARSRDQRRSRLRQTETTNTHIDARPKAQDRNRLSPRLPRLGIKRDASCPCCRALISPPTQKAIRATPAPTLASDERSLISERASPSSRLRDCSGPMQAVKEARNQRRRHHVLRSVRDIRQARVDRSAAPAQTRCCRSAEPAITKFESAVSLSVKAIALPHTCIDYFSDTPNALDRGGLLASTTCARH